MLKFLRRNRKSQQSLSKELDYNQLPIFTADELIRYTGQQNRLRSIQRIVKIDDGHFGVMYLDVIYRFAEIVQLMPASQAHHHAVPGGLFIHTLEVIEQAMNLRQQYKLPAFAEQEVQERERHAWTYGVFVAAILHDIGKRVTMCAFIRDDDEIHSAFDEILLSATGCKHYRLVFQDPKYHAMHEEIGLAMFDIVPPIGRAFLFNHLNIIKEMMAYIHGDSHNAGTIGEIIIKADQKSTGQSLAHTPSHKFRGASLENFGERLMTCLRQLIASNVFIINKTNANIYTSRDGYTYCVSKVIVDGIRKELTRDGRTDIPSDNNRIFDTFQEYGFCETNQNTGKSIHTICIYHNGTVHIFTVLKFKTSKLFRNPPEAYEGIIEEVISREAVQKAKQAQIGTESNSMQLTGTGEKDIQIAGTEKIVAEANRISTFHEPVAANNENPISGADNPFATTETVVGDLLDDMLDDVSATETENTVAQEVEADNNKNQTTGAVTEKSVTEIGKKSEIATDKPQKQETKKSANENLAYAFLAWCRKQVIDREIVINESNGLIQKVNYKGNAVVAIVSPRTFGEYASVLGLPSPMDRSSVGKIQSPIHKEKLNIPGFRGQLHYFKIKKSFHNPLNGSGKLIFYLFETDKFAQSDLAFMEIWDTVNVNTNLVKT